MFKGAVLMMLEAIFVPMSQIGTLKESIITGQWASVWTMVQNVYNNVAMPVALFFLVLWFVKAVLDNSMLFRGNPEQVIFKPLIKFIIGFIVMKYGLTLITHFLDLGTALVASITTTSNGAAMDAAARVGIYSQMFPKSIFAVSGTAVEITKMDLGEGISAIIMLLVPMVVTLFVQFIMLMTIYGRQLEMYIRVAFAPIALSDIYAEGSSGAGWRYLKVFIAISIQGAMLYFVLMLGSHVFAAIVINGKLTGGLLDIIIPVCAVLLAQMTLVGMTKSISRELLGV